MVTWISMGDSRCRALCFGRRSAGGGFIDFQNSVSLHWFRGRRRPPSEGIHALLVTGDSGALEARGRARALSAGRGSPSSRPPRGRGTQPSVRPSTSAGESHIRRSGHWLSTTERTAYIRNDQDPCRSQRRPSHVVLLHEARGGPDVSRRVSGRLR